MNTSTDESAEPIFYFPQRPATGMLPISKHAGPGDIVFQGAQYRKWPCSICASASVAGYAHLTGQFIEFAGKRAALQYDYFLCQSCLTRFRAEDSEYLENVVVERKKRSGTYASAQDEESGRQRLKAEYEFVRRLMTGREFKSTTDPDYRFNFATGFKPGTLPSKGIDSDAHAWLSEEGSWSVQEGVGIRRAFSERFSYAIPNLDALQAIADCSPNGVVEYGCGSAYWSSLLTNMDVPVRAIDLDPRGPQMLDFVRYNANLNTWMSVDRGGIGRLSRGTANRTLLLVWPPEINTMAIEAIDTWRGDTLAYVGEWFGCTATQRFHERLAQEWTLVNNVQIPTFYGWFDKLMIFKR